MLCASDAIRTNCVRLALPCVGDPLRACGALPGVWLPVTTGGGDDRARGDDRPFCICTDPCRTGPRKEGSFSCSTAFVIADAADMMETAVRALPVDRRLCTLLLGDRILRVGDVAPLGLPRERTDRMLALLDNILCCCC